MRMRISELNVFKMAICTVQVTNVSPKATFQNIKELFSYFGDIDELKVFPEDEEKKDIPSRVCFVTFKERNSLETALHLTNTILVDRALVVSQSRYEVIPEESTAMSLAAPAVAIALPDPIIQNTMSVPLLPTPTLSIPQTPSLLGTPLQQPLLQNPLVTAIQQAQSVASSINANIQPIDDPLAPQQPALINAAGSLIPPTPNLTGNVDPTKIDEIRRTIYVGNLNSTLTADQVMNFFQTCGEIKYVRMAGDETQPARFAFVEFSNPESVQIALQYNGAMFGDRPVKVNHSKNAIVKPQGKTPEMAQKEVDEAMKKVREATQAITTTIVEPVKSRSRSRSRSRDRRRSGHRRRSGSRDRHRRRSYSRSPRRRKYYSPSPRRRDYRRNSWRDRRSRSRSPGRYRSSQSFKRRSPERDRRRRKSRTRSRSRSPSPHRHRRGPRDKDERSKEHTRGRRKSASRSPSPDRKRSKKAKKEKKRHKRSPSPNETEDFDDQHSEGGSPLGGSPVPGDESSADEEEEAGSSMSD